MTPHNNYPVQGTLFELPSAEIPPAPYEGGRAVMPLVPSDEIGPRNGDRRLEVLEDTGYASTIVAEHMVGESAEGQTPHIPEGAERVRVIEGIRQALVRKGIDETRKDTRGRRW